MLEENLKALIKIQYVDSITKKLASNGYSSHTLITEIVTSVPFRMKARSNP